MAASRPSETALAAICAGNMERKLDAETQSIAKSVAVVCKLGEGSFSPIDENNAFRSFSPLGKFTVTHCLFSSALGFRGFLASALSAEHTMIL